MVKVRVNAEKVGVLGLVVKALASLASGQGWIHLWEGANEVWAEE